MYLIRLVALVVTFWLLALFAFNCAGKKSTPVTEGPAEPAVTELTSLFDDQHLRWGIKSDSGTLLHKNYFVINHNDDWKIPYWVAYFLSDSNLAGDTPRTDDFRADPSLQQGHRSELEDYRDSGYDRGHNAPAASFKRNHEAMSATFLLSNICPQASYMNRHVWSRIEDRLRDMVDSETEAWVVTGNICYGPGDALGDSSFQRIGPNRVAVPRSCYKAILLMDVQDSSFKEVFYLVENRSGLESTDPGHYETSEAHLEQITGYDFFPVADSIMRQRSGRAGIQKQ
jgi:endonuclease G